MISALRHAISAAFSLVLALLVQEAQAEAYPEFEGIYFQMDDGSFVQLPISKARGTRSVQFHVGWTHTNALGNHFFGWEDLQNLPVVDLDRAGPIVVVGNKPQELILFPLAEVSDYFAEFTNNPEATATYTASNQSTDMAAGALPPLFVRQNCGVGNDRFMRTKPIDNFITEFHPKEGSDWPQESYGENCVELTDHAVAMELLVDGAYYAQFLTKIGKEEFESTQLSEGPAASSERGDTQLISESPDLFNVFEYLASDSCGVSCTLDGVVGTYSITKSASVKTALSNSQKVLRMAVGQGGNAIVLGPQEQPIPDLDKLISYFVEAESCAAQYCGGAIVLVGESRGYFVE